MVVVFYCLRGFALQPKVRQLHFIRGSACSARLPCKPVSECKFRTPPCRDRGSALLCFRRLLHSNRSARLRGLKDGKLVAIHTESGGGSYFTEDPGGESAFGAATLDDP